MARPPRNNEPGTIHHLMNQGVDRSDVFISDTDRLTFEELNGQMVEEHDVTVLAYCLMGNHYHSIVRAGEDGISTGMQQLASSYTRIVNERTGRVGPLFRGRFTSVTIESDEQLIATVAYVHRNPIDLVPAAALAAYRWSSYGVYLGRRTAPVWLDTTLVSGLITPAEHQRLVDDGLDDRHGDRRRDRRIELFEAVARSVPPSSELGQPVAVVAAAEIGWTTSDLVSAFGVASPGAARTALSRSRRRCLQSPEAGALVDRIVACVTRRRSHPDGVTRGV